MEQNYDPKRKNTHCQMGLFFLLFFLFACLPDSSQDRNPDLLLLLAAGQVSKGKGSTNVCPPTPLPGGIAIADQVADAPGEDSPRPFGSPSLAVNGICGSGEFTGSLDVYELQKSGEGARIVLSWSGRIVENTEGVDFVVFENPFRLRGRENEYFVEPVIAEVSLDNTNYCGFDPRFRGVRPPTPMPSSTQTRDDWESMAGLTPVLYNMGSNPLTKEELFSSAQKQITGNTYYMDISGGDGFDLDDLTDSGYRTPDSGMCIPGILSDLKSQGFRYLKLTAVQAAGFPSPIGAFREAADIDGVIAKSTKPDF